MLRTFGADRLKGVLDSFRVSEDMPLESKMVTDAIDQVATSSWECLGRTRLSGILSPAQVQKKVEDYYSDIRGQIFTFDEVGLHGSLLLHA